MTTPTFSGPWPKITQRFEKIVLADAEPIYMAPIPLHTNVPIKGDNVALPIMEPGVLPILAHTEARTYEPETGIWRPSSAQEVDEYDAKIDRIDVSMADLSAAVDIGNAMSGSLVTVPPFWAAQTPVTIKQWASIMGETKSGLPGSPATQVSWFAAVQFLNKLSEARGLTPRYHIQGDPDAPTKVYVDDDADGFAMPHEAAWFVAAMGGTNSEYYGPVDDIAWHYNNTPDPKQAQPVGRKRPNKFGLHDMQGNVWVWCENEY